MHLPSLQQSASQHESFPSFDFNGQESLSLQQLEQQEADVCLVGVIANAAFENAKSINATTERIVFFLIVYFPFYFKRRFLELVFIEPQTQFDPKSAILNTLSL